VRVLYFHRDDGVHDRRFLDALGQLPVDVFTLQLENHSNALDGWKPATNIHRVNIPHNTGSLQWFQVPKYLANLKQIVRENRVDVIHAGPIDLCAWLAARAGLAPLVSMSWGYDLLVNANRDPLSRRRIQYALQHSSIILDDCQAVSDAAMRYGFPQERIVTFPWGVDLQVYIPRKVKNSGARSMNSKTIVLLSTRRMEKLYGCDVIVDAFIKAASQEDELRLTMLGDGEQRQHLMRRIAAAGLEGRVQFAGNIPEDEMVTKFQASDVYISASHSDGSSVSLLQAMACGLPVIVSDIPGNREWVGEGWNGWLFKDGDQNELASLMLEASRSVGLRAVYGRQARKIVVDRADWKKNSARLMDAYHMAIELDRQGARARC
jgi:glycosyltransferase involved in cell wall biosynthesis